MALPLLIAIVSAPALLGTQEAIRQSQSKEKREEHRARRCNLIASCVKSSMRSREINGRPIVLKDGKLWIDTGTGDEKSYGHPYAGYYLPYPDTSYEGLVTTITDVAPIMNWVYVDKDTYEVKYGVRLDAQPNHTGPFDCTRQDRRLTFDGWEGWCAVEEFPTLWALYFDKDDDGLKSKVAEGTRVLEIELTRKEKRWKKDGEERQQDQTTKRAVETKEDAPIDNPITAQPELSPPGVGVPNEKAPEPLRPFGLPRSIFSDPPRPIFLGKEMLPPRSPPPAYYREDPVPPPVDEIALPPPVPVPDTKTSPLPATDKSTEVRPDTPPQAPQNLPFDATYSNKAFETPRKAPTPSYTAETTPLAPAPLRVTPAAEKRVTPKLNRMSGTRAMSQAQIFEAWAMGQTPTNESTFKQSESRPTSNITTTSTRSDEPRVNEDDMNQMMQMYGDLKASTTKPKPSSPPLERAQLQPSASLKVSDPAVFARLSSGSSTTSDPAIVKDKPSGKGPMQRRGDSPRRGSPDGGAPRSTPSGRRQASVSGRNRDFPPDQQRRPSASTARDSPRSTRTGRSNGSRDFSPPRERNGSASSQPRGPPLRQRTDIVPRGERPSPRPSVSRTNTAPVRDGVQRSRTTTATLIRELDDFVGTEISRSGSAASNPSRTRRNNSRDEDRRSPPRRTIADRETRRNDSAGSRSERIREAARGRMRRDERDTDRRI